MKCSKFIFDLQSQFLFFFVFKISKMYAYPFELQQALQKYTIYCVECEIYINVTWVWSGKRGSSCCP